MSGGDLSKGRQRINRSQRERRASCRRVDYYASPEALAVIEAKRAQSPPGGIHATNSAVLDSIVSEWATLVGINKGEVETPMTTGDGAGISRHVRARAYDFGGRLPFWALDWLAENRAKQASGRVICGARRHRDGQPCKAKSEPGKRRCKWHGGQSTGPQTTEGKARALANLRQYRTHGASGDRSP